MTIGVINNNYSNDYEDNFKVTVSADCLWRGK